MKHNFKRTLSLILALVMALGCVQLSAFATEETPTGYSGAPLPAGPTDMNSTTINVNADNAQYVLDGAYGNINGKTINFTENVTEVLDLARPTKYQGSGTTGLGSGSKPYSRTLENVTFTASDDVTLAGFYFRPGHIHAFDDYSKYNYVEDRAVTSTNDGYYRNSTLTNITFSGLTVNGTDTASPFYFIGSQENATVSGIKFTGCTITSSNDSAINCNNNGTLGYGSITVENCVITANKIGVYINGVGSGEITLKNNSIFGDTNNAISIWDDSAAGNEGSVTVTGNYLKSNKYTVNLNNFASSQITFTGNAVVAGSRGHLGHYKGNANDNFWAAQGSTPDSNRTMSTTLTAPIVDTEAGAGENDITYNSSYDTAVVNTSAKTWVTLSNTPKPAPVTYVAQIGTTQYATLAAAIEAAQSGDTVTLLDDVALTATQEINKNLTINLNGKNITATDARALWVKNGNVEITGTGTVSASGDALAADSSVIRVGDKSTNPAAAKLTIDTGVTVSSDKCYGITAFGVNNTDGDLTTADIELVINGTVNVTGTASAVSGNGTSTLSATTMTINGTVSATQDYAIYHPGKGTLTVNGTVTGLGGIEAKGGTVTVNSGATVTATAGKQTHTAYNNGASTSGYAIAAVNNPNYAGDPQVTISSDATITGKAIILADFNAQNVGTVTAKSNTIATDPGFAWAATGTEGEYKLVELTAVAQIGNVPYTNLQSAFDAAQDGETITLLADVTLSDRVFVNAGATPAYDSSNKRYATTSDTRSITLDLNGHKISGASNIALAGGSLNVTGTGTISTSTGGLAPIEVRGTGNLTAKRTLTIGENVTLTGDTYGLNVFGSNDAQANKIDVTVNGTVSGQLFVLGNLTNTSNAINIVVNAGATLTSIAENGYANVTINGGLFTEAANSCVEVRAGTLTINGGTFTNNAASFSCTSNNSGTTTKGAAIAIAQHTTDKPINVTINGGTFTGPCALSIANPQSNATNNVTVSVTGGYFKGTTSTVAQTVKNDDNRVTGFISGGIFFDDTVGTGAPSIKTDGYVATGYEAVKLTGGNTTDATAAYVDWYQVGEVKTADVAKDDASSTDSKVVFTATKKVESSEVINETTGDKQELSSGTSITVNVTGTTVDETPTFTSGNVEATTTVSQIDSTKYSEVVNNIVAAADTNSSTIDVQIEIVSDTPQVENSTTSMPTITYEIHPEAVAYENATKVGSTKITNSQLAEGASFTLKLKVPDAVYNKITKDPKTVTVVHKKDDGTFETYSGLAVSGTSGAYYVTITGVTSFSDFELTPDKLESASVSCTANLALEDSINVNLYIHSLKNVTAKQLTLKYTVQGENYQKNLSELTLSGGSYGIVLAKCAAAEIADDITFAIYKGDAMIWPVSGTPFTYSPKIYCERQLAKGGLSAEEQALDKALLDYGTYAQTRFNHSTDKPANANYSYGGVGGVTVPDTYAYESIGTIAGYGVSANLELESKTELNFTFYKIGGGNADGVVISVKKDGDAGATVIDNAGTAGDYVRMHNTNGSVTLKVNGIASAQLGTKYIVTFTVGTESRAITYSPMSFALRKQYDDTEGDVSKALYNYFLTAQAYFNTK